MPRKLAVPTRGDKKALAERVKTLFFAGNSLSDACRMAGGDYEAIKKRAQREGWQDQIREAQALVVRASPKVPTAQNVAFDLAQTNRQSRAALAQIHNLAIMEQLRQLTENPAKIAVETPQDLKALVESQAKVDPAWEDSSASKFAVALNLNQVVQSGAIREIPPGYTVVESD